MRLIKEDSMEKMTKKEMKAVKGGFWPACNMFCAVYGMNRSITIGGPFAYYNRECVKYLKAYGFTGCI